MPAFQSQRTAKSPRSASPAWRYGAIVALLAAAFFALGLRDEPFVDEYAYITQSYQPDLVFSGRRNDPTWLEELGYDLVPLPKLWINLAFRTAGISRPTPWNAVVWYSDTSHRWGSDQELIIARLPSVVLAAIGCAAIFAIGTLVGDRQTGVIAAILLAVNPLYALHAHRAMSEAGCEAFMLIALALALKSWKSLLQECPITLSLVLMAAAGCCAGLSVLSKFSGILAPLTWIGWSLLLLVLPGISRKTQLVFCAATAFAILTASLVFIVLNPFMTAQPGERLSPELTATANLNTWRRFRLLVEHRGRVSSQQQAIFAHNALHSVAARASVVLCQGFGRFGPLGPRKSDSTRRYDPHQDWGALLWLPLVLAGGMWAVRLGKQQLRQARPPSGWAVAVWAAICLLVVTAYLPMAWDRYQLPLQAPAAVLAALQLVRWPAAIRSWTARPSLRS